MARPPLFLIATLPATVVVKLVLLVGRSLGCLAVSTLLLLLLLPLLLSVFLLLLTDSLWR